MIKDFVTGIQHIGIPTKDMAATREFYAKLGFEVAFETVNDGSQVVFFRLHDLTIEAYEDENAAKAVGAIEHIAVNVTDIEKAYEEVCNAQMNTMNDEIHALPFWDNGVRFFTIMGPNCEKIEFSQYI
jgi:catechol 2,3-dioxygenase-like lactoylglutathione lyase family enzyme